MSRDIGSSEIMRSMRLMAWERAMGELNSMLQTYWGSTEEFEAINNVASRFITEVEDEGLHE